MIVRAQQNDTLDLLCWRHLGQTAGVVEAALAMNPGLAELGAILPHGQLVSLPDPATPASTTAKTVPSVNLWD